MRRLAVAGMLFLAGAAGCHKASTAASSRLPTGDAVWFADGVAEGAGDTELAVTRGGFAAVYLPLTRLLPEGERWNSIPATPPSKPFSRIPVILVISAGEETAAALAGPRGAVPLADAIWLAAKAGLRDAAQFGNVRGIHLDVPFAVSSAEAFGALVRSVRGKLPPGILLTQSLRVTPAETERDAMRKAGTSSDGWIAFVFGEGGGADPGATDALGRPWYAAYSPAAAGRWTTSSGDRALPEGFLSLLTNDSHVEFAHDLTVREEAVSGFLLTPHAPITVGGIAFRPGEKIQFRQPSLSDMVYRLGADLAGKRLVRGRVVVLSGRTEQDRIFTLAALDEILLGRPLNADLRVSIDVAKATILIGAENPTPHASVVSRTSNWVEVDVPGGNVADVRAGGFDRYEVFGTDGGAVTLGRATRLRFFETLVSPWEKIEPAHIVLRKPPRAGCCAYRIHVLSSAGAEVAREGDAAPKQPAK